MAREAEPSGKTAKDGDQPDNGTAQANTPQTGATPSGGTQTGARAAAATQGNASARGADQGRNDTDTDADADTDTDTDDRNDGFGQLRAHHQKLRALLGEASGLTDEDGADELLDRLSDAWARHAEAHAVLYDCATDAGLQEFPALTETAIDGDLVSFLLRSSWALDGPLALAALRVAARLIGEIIEREEKPRSGLLAKAKAAGVDPVALGRDLGACLTAPSRRGGELTPRVRHLTAIQEDIMPRNSNMPDRDEYGRFVSDDDRGGRGRSSGRYDNDRERDSRGRFVSDDDHRGGRSRSSSRDDDDDRRYSRGRDDDRSYSRSSRRDDDDDRGYSRDRGQGGWFGDSRGHSEAARLGWEHRRDDDDDDYGRGRSRSSRRDDDDDRRYSRGRDDDRGYSRSSSSRRDDDDDRGYSRDRGQGGWFGDSRGHSEAARLGWEHRRDDDDDDDRRYGRGGRR
ncbi:hypothetical protein [Paracoccus alkenifer]|uniref:Uncharacterized protein n=1 Tax=Paracoccus alkenifer TaxID=65735 RepID=A0A1H6JZI9_9RHOB|nr:hypothetical protein [Paracoccus alkenifer]SEH68081.1 hypothetical protein SAMN04488075_0754 [Paracoccus alkenifer]